jgi:hypothetical protein
MPFIRKNISWTSIRGLVLCALLLPTAIVLTAFGFARSKTNRASMATTDSVHPAASVAVTLQRNSSTTLLDAEHITLRSTGFEPNEITRPAGRFLLAVDNLTSMGEMSFRLLHQSGTRLRDFPATKGRFRLRQVVDLPPGRYALVEAKHPDWICRVIISAP